MMDVIYLHYLLPSLLVEEPYPNCHGILRAFLIRLDTRPIPFFLQPEKRTKFLSDKSIESMGKVGQIALQK